MRAVLALLCSALLASAPVVAADAPASVPVDEGSSVDRFVERVAIALEGRARAEKLTGQVVVEAAPSRGIDVNKVERAFLVRLRKRLKDGGVLVPSSESSLRCRIVLSEEGSLVWAMLSLEGGTLIGPTMVAVSVPVDRELEAALGTVVKPAQTRFVLERLGPVPPGNLDAELIDIDGDGMDELALFGVEGLRFFRVGPARLEKIGGLIKLSERRWPRVPVGWLVTLEVDAAPARSTQKLWAVTSAGHSLIYDVKLQTFEPGPPDLVPLRGAVGPDGPLAATWRQGSPVVALPLKTRTGALVKTPSLPGRVRDIATMRGTAGAWLVVDEQGQLLSQKTGEPPTAIATERVGDRITLADLEGDGEPELITTSSSAPGEPDHLVLRRIAPDLSSSTVVFRSPLSGGSIIAAAVGRLDFGSRPDVVLIEEVGDEALAWRLRYAP